ncbi:Alpha/Beta hydrolase protein [Blastocladiella britannica]|nr:Alpha/Beta hydrolase protein [Blastocladiella britannica]
MDFINALAVFDTLVPAGAADSVQVRAMDVGGIALTVYVPAAIAAATAPVPTRVVFCLHGRQGSQRDMAPVARALATLASATLPIVAVTFDQRNHGGRMVREDANNGWPTDPARDDGNQMFAFDMYSIQQGTATDVSFLVDHLPARLGFDTFADPTEWGVIGFSLGGHASLLAVTGDERISAAVSIVGCGDYETLMTDRHAGVLKRYPTSKIAPLALAMPPQLLKLVRRIDPVHRIPTAHRPKIRMLFGGDDTLVPASASAKFIDAVTAAYSGCPDRFRASSFPGVGHGCSREMAEAALEWLQ